MTTRRYLAVSIEFSLAATLVSCSTTNPVSHSSAADLIAACETLEGEFRLPPNPGGPPDNNPNSQIGLIRQFGDPDVKTRADAAMKFLRHSERRVPGALETAIGISGRHGDFRVINNLARIASQHARNGERGDNQDGGLIAYPVSTRIAASGALGRILEMDRSAPPGRPSDETGDGIDEEAESLALHALMLASCPGQDTNLRAAALEAIGLLRTPASVEYLELSFANPGESDPVRSLFLRTVAGRSLTNTLHNNHLLDSDVDERLREILQAYQDQASQEAP